MSAARVFPPELLEEIINHLSGCTVDLLACARVCRACVDRAQKHLFCSITIGDESDDEDAAWVCAGRLGNALFDNPRLVAYVRELHLRRCSDHIVRPLARIAWTRLLVLSLGKGVISCPEVLFPLVSLSCVRDLCIHAGLMTPSQLRILLGKCSLDISRIQLNTLLFTDAPLYNPPLFPKQDAAVRRNSNDPPKITHLDFERSRGVLGEFLHHLKGIPELLNVRHIRGRDDRWSWLPFILHLAGDAVQSLDIDGSDPSLETVNFSSLPQLSHLAVCGVGRPLASFMQQSGENPIQMVSYHLAGGGQPELHDLEEIILSPRMPLLQKVEVRVVLRDFRQKGASYEECVSFVETHMPRIFERGLLTVVFD
ncbi:hypothetical protein R3P38DRAFT_3475813 [Favolaschia claudopus]|uniref:F-box domain-containing protein n=1 Tax=Favolaschia claudopus TaxID=2862362 RepID=A0AAW0CIA2_9AGAR